eukprot:11422208-Ditylum_brightwellii.AAC.1
MRQPQKRFRQSCASDLAIATPMTWQHLWRIRLYAPLLPCIYLTGDIEMPSSVEAAASTGVFRTSRNSLLTSSNAPNTNGIGPPYRK